MPHLRYLQHSPITEAVIDLRVKARPNLDPQDFSQLTAALAESFPKVERRIGGKVTFQLSSAGAAPAAIEDLGVQGYFLKSLDEKLVAQFRVDGFTLNRLRPYTSWSELLPMALGLWRHYCSVALPETVTRIALRYINHIPLPSDLTDFDQYLRAAPTVPSELPQDVGAFFSRVTIHDKLLVLDTHVIQALETDANQRVTFLLDIDAFKPVDMAWNHPELETSLNQLHELKNLIFFNYLTDETLRRFE